MRRCTNRAPAALVAGMETKMASPREKLETISYRGFNVSNIEAMQTQLRELVTWLYLQDAPRALNVAHVIESRSKELVGQLERHVARKGA
jgi:hypothetical protein